MEIALQLEPGINVMANPNLLASALENILRNAVIYTEQDSVVDIVMRADSSVEIDIGDRGPGVPDSELEKIFQPFHRVESARERHSGGEGVGLAIAARVADIHGGSISATNRDAGGLRIRMTLPRKV